jgi:hypothetical protein
LRDELCSFESRKRSDVHDGILSSRSNSAEFPGSQSFKKFDTRVSGDFAVESDKLFAFDPARRFVRLRVRVHEGSRRRHVRRRGAWMCPRSTIRKTDSPLHLNSSAGGYHEISCSFQARHDDDLQVVLNAAPIQIAGAL